MSTNMKEIEFPVASYTEWQEQAVKALKGKPFESLFTKTIENITLEPLYTKESLLEKLGDQLEKQVATVRHLTKEATFGVAQQIVGDTADAFIANLEESLARGNDVITIDSAVAFTWDEPVIAKLVALLSENSFKIAVTNANDPLLAIFEGIDAAKRADVTGLIVSPSPITLADYPNVRTFAANTVAYHNDGANATQELAIALSLAAKQANEASDFDVFAAKFFVNFAVDTQFFTEIAKLRAFKVLWNAFTAAYGKEAQAVPVAVETSVRSFSKLDVYVNLLRAGNEAFSAAIGGADLITVHPHDILTKVSDQSVRIARNVLLVTKEESHVLNVLDPAGGSYFVESLTADLVKDAWALFLDIERAGGIDAYDIATPIAQVHAERIASVEKRKTVLVGTNNYADPTETVPAEENAQFADVKRLAIPFENLRKEFAANPVKTAILTFGELKNFKARADFVAGVFATAGVVPTQSEAFTSVEEAKAWLNNSDFDYVCVAATDEDTKEIVPALLDGKRATVILDAAGRYKEEADAWTAAGLNGFVFAGQNLVEKLQSVATGAKEVQR
ncbi:MAG: methylmalonyl-CoA mutase family protein [Solibacillus sp.]